MHDLNVSMYMTAGCRTGIAASTVGMLNRRTGDVYACLHTRAWLCSTAWQQRKTAWNVMQEVRAAAADHGLNEEQAAVLAAVQGWSRRLTCKVR